MLESAARGSRWWLYGSKWVAQEDLVTRLAANDIRVLHHGYQLVGLPCSYDPVGLGAPHSIGRSVIITLTDRRRIRIRHPRLPSPYTMVLRLGYVSFPTVLPERRIPFDGQEIDILGRHPSLGRGNAPNHVATGQMMGFYFHRPAARHALWAARRHFVSNHFGRARSRARIKEGIFPIVSPFCPSLMKQVYGAGRLMGILPGIATSTRR